MNMCHQFVQTGWTVEALTSSSLPLVLLTPPPPPPSFLSPWNVDLFIPGPVSAGHLPIQVCSVPLPWRLSYKCFMFGGDCLLLTSARHTLQHSSRGSSQPFSCVEKLTGREHVSWKTANLTRSAVHKQTPENEWNAAWWHCELSTLWSFKWQNDRLSSLNCFIWDQFTEMRSSRSATAEACWLKHTQRTRFSLFWKSKKERRQVQCSLEEAICWKREEEDMKRWWSKGTKWKL